MMKLCSVSYAVYATHFRSTQGKRSTHMGKEWREEEEDLEWPQGDSDFEDGYRRR